MPIPIAVHIFDTPILLLTRLLEYSYCGDLRRDLCGHIPPPLGCGTRPARGARARVLVIVYHGRGMRLYGTYKINISISSISIRVLALVVVLKSIGVNQGRTQNRHRATSTANKLGTRTYPGQSAGLLGRVPLRPYTVHCQTGRSSR